MSKLFAALLVGLTLGLSITFAGCDDGNIMVAEKQDDIISSVADSGVVDSSEAQSEKHEHGKIFSFQPQGSTAASNVRPFCENGDHYYLGYTLFRGTPDDVSYLEVIREHGGGKEIVGGEYYTITATVVLGDYDFDRTRIRCEVRSDGIIVNFSVDFQEVFEESVASFDSGDEITFRGRFYDEGCGFTDCELITE